MDISNTISVNYKAFEKNRNLVSKRVVWKFVLPCLLADQRTTHIRAIINYYK